MNVRNMTLGSRVAIPVDAAQPAANTGQNTASGFSVAAASSEISDAMTGRITLAVIEGVIILGIVFYLYTHSVQGGG
jgi:hypothetical protein